MRIALATKINVYGEVIRDVDSELSSVETRTHPERQYLDLLADVIKNGERRLDRTGVGTLGVFGRQMRFDLTVGFPLFTTKYVHFPAIKQELAWFLSGSTNIGSLRGGGCRIWNEWAEADGDLGPVYGKQWRSWAAPEWCGRLTRSPTWSALRQKPRMPPPHRLSAWNPADVEEMALPPCHCLFQFYVADGRFRASSTSDRPTSSWAFRSTSPATPC